MSIGYYNFGNIQQGNQIAAASLAGLGQQIGQAIETHAQTQAAQAMLPALQQSFSQGMQKVASGDPSGLSDVYGAAASASQLPILAPFANHAIAVAQSANINAQHMARTQAYLQGKNLSEYGKYGSDFMAPPPGTNPAWKGKQSTTQQDPLKQQAQIQAMYQKYTKEGNDAAGNGDWTAYDNAALNRSALAQQLSKMTGTPQQFPLNAKGAQLARKLAETINDQSTPAQKQMALNSIKALANDPSNVALTPEQQDVLKQAQSYVGKKPLPALQQRLQQIGLPPTLLKVPQQQAPQQQTQQSSMGAIPAANSPVADNTPENQDEAEAVNGSDEQES